MFPDISESPRFFLDTTGAVVNGDCYWITLKEGVEEDWLLLMLAIANSSFITRYYDVAFHNKLYAGRRRFMTQYVKDFPLPRLHSCREADCPLDLGAFAGPDRYRVRARLDELVCEAFGLPAEGPQERGAVPVTGLEMSH